MKIPASEYQNNQFTSAKRASVYAAAREIQSDFERLSADVVQLDNRVGVDKNSTKGLIVLNNCNVRELLHPEDKDEPKKSPFELMDDRVRGMEDSLSGEVKLDGNGKVSSLDLGNDSIFGGYIEAHHSKGFLGLGQERLIISTFNHDRNPNQVVTLFQDGTVDYKSAY